MDTGAVADADAGVGGHQNEHQKLVLIGQVPAEGVGVGISGSASAAEPGSLPTGTSHKATPGTVSRQPAAGAPVVGDRCHSHSCTGVQRLQPTQLGHHQAPCTCGDGAHATPAAGTLDAAALAGDDVVKGHVNDRAAAAAAASYQQCRSYTVEGRKGFQRPLLVLLVP
jgi:hypothetical protein